MLTKPPNVSLNIEKTLALIYARRDCAIRFGLLIRILRQLARLSNHFSFKQEAIELLDQVARFAMRTANSAKNHHWTPAAFRKHVTLPVRVTLIDEVSSTLTLGKVASVPNAPLKPHLARF